jgi:hypothetical protein
MSRCQGGTGPLVDDTAEVHPTAILGGVKVAHQACVGTGEIEGIGLEHNDAERPDRRRNACHRPA